ncbi:MAG TPA: sigma-70 family RNA polymerase sigma factor [bacterium]|nr:sigma-70 family RNA polymerase sigma factor [bacterium]
MRGDVDLPEERELRGPVDPASYADADAVARLRDGDEAAFVSLVDRHAAAMLRVASMHLPRAAAEEVVQDTWLGVLQGIAGFEQRSTLKTWIFSILMNRVRTQAQRERRSVPFSALADAPSDQEPAVEPGRFLGADHPRWPGHWASPPESWGDSPEERLLSAEVRAEIQHAIDRLPPDQREVITLRDVEGWAGEEVSTLLQITPNNERVLLHRARSKVRRALERYFGEG